MSKQRIILYAPLFYGYWKMIKKALEEQGHEVEFVSYRTNKIEDTIINFADIDKINNTYEKIIQQRLERLTGKWDTLIVIKGQYFSKKHIEWLRSKNEGIRCVMYQWDSIKNHNYLKLSESFDKVMTFDFQDAKDYNIPYLPLFYTDDIYPVNNRICDIDLLLVGIYNKDRYEYLKRLKSLSGKLKIYTHLVLPPTEYIKREFIKRELNIQSLNDIKFWSLNRNKLIDLYRRSKVFIDVCKTSQTGMSMRTIEAYGMNKKLLTSNTHIHQDPWVKELITLDTTSSNGEILEFCKNSFIPSYHNRHKLSLHNWVHTLLQ